MIISRKFHFTDNELWHWPDHDRILLESMGTLRDAEKITEWVRPQDRVIAVQAGGACGLWAAVLARHFRQVYTFEPVPDNYTCLRLNLARAGLFQTEIRELCGERTPQVITAPWALSDNAGIDAVHRVEGNAGAGYIEPVIENHTHTWAASEIGGDVCDLVALDSLNLDGVGLIQLDVEGHELKALQGAGDTIARCRPVVVLEEKQHPHSQSAPDAAGHWLCHTYNYRPGERYHNDQVYLPC